jgi:hypothetical protein
VNVRLTLCYLGVENNKRIDRVVPMLNRAPYCVFWGTNKCIRLYVATVGTAWPLLDLSRKVQVGLTSFKKHLLCCKNSQNFLYCARS